MHKAYADLPQLEDRLYGKMAKLAIKTYSRLTCKSLQHQLKLYEKSPSSEHETSKLLGIDDSDGGDYTIQEYSRGNLSGGFSGSRSCLVLRTRGGGGR